MTGIYLIDDDADVRTAIVLLLSTLGMAVRDFDGPVSFIEKIDSLQPGIIVLDLRMPVMSGLALQRELKVRNMTWPVIMISGHGDIDACREAFRAGAVDFLTKPVDERDLIDAIRLAQQALDADLGRRGEQVASDRMLASLTTREEEVLELIAKGLATKEIARVLAISPRTVESHRAALGSKLGTTAVADMTRLWLGRADRLRSPTGSGR